MKELKKGRSGSIWAGIAFVLWLIVNIRVEAGLGNTFERAIDGLVGGALLLMAVFVGMRFFGCDKQECRANKSCMKK